MTPCPSCGGPRVAGTVRLRGWVALGLSALPFAAGMLVGASFLADVIEGVDRTRLPVWRLAVVFTAVAGTILAGIARLRRPVCLRCAGGVFTMPAGATRRAVLRAGGIAAAATAGGVAGVVLPNRGW